jgi:large subunit ribosomal protein L22
MSKPQSPRKVATTEAFASVRNIKGSVQKAQLVLGLVRGMKVSQALNELAFCHKRLAEPARKVLLSAIANAENNHNLNVDKLVVARAYADKSIVMKRWTARGRGRSAGILKPRVHMTMVVAEQEMEVAAPKAAAPAKATKPTASKPAAKKTNPEAAAPEAQAAQSE